VEVVVENVVLVLENVVVTMTVVIVDVVTVVEASIGISVTVVVWTETEV